MKESIPSESNDQFIPRCTLQNHLIFTMCRYKLVTSGEHWHLLDGKDEGCTHVDESRYVGYVFTPPCVC